MTWKVRCLTFLALVIGSQLNAASHYSDCCGPFVYDNNSVFSCEPCEDFYIYGDYLAWRPRRCGLEYAIPYFDFTDETNGVRIDGSVKSVHPKYSSGFRVGAILECGQVNYGIHYTNYSFHNKSETAGLSMAALLVQAPFQATDNGDIGLAKAKYGLNYEVVDVELGCNLLDTDCGYARWFCVFKYANICQSFDVRYIESFVFLDSTVADRVRQSVNMNAYGLLLGVDGNFFLCDCVDVIWSLSYGGLLGDFSRKFKHDADLGILDNLIDFDFVDVNLRDNCWKFVSNLNLSLGLEFVLPNCFWGGDWRFAFGYEFHQWVCIPDFLKFETSEQVFLEDRRTGISADRASDAIGFDGWFIRLSASL